jgi:hypothetical protein
MTFWMAMILNPRIQKKAQVELDAVIGKDGQTTPIYRASGAEVSRWAPLCQSFIYPNLPNVWYVYN